jgi:hypothetical protein
VGGVGKDTICGIVANHYRVKNISAIDPIKQIATYGGRDYSDKSPKGRKLLSDIKLAFIDYNDLPLKHLLTEYSNFLEDSNEILFVHIRETGEIKKFKDMINSDCITLLVTSNESIVYGNFSDDDVINYQYDYTYKNILSLAALEEDFMCFFSSIIRR